MFSCLCIYICMYIYKLNIYTTSWFTLKIGHFGSQNIFLWLMDWLIDWFLVLSMFTVHVFWGSLGTSISVNLSSTGNNTRTRLLSRLPFRFLWLWFRCTETKQNKVKNKDSILKKVHIYFCTFDQFNAAAELFHMFSDHVPSPIVPIQGQ